MLKSEDSSYGSPINYTVSAGYSDPVSRVVTIRDVKNIAPGNTPTIRTTAFIAVLLYHPFIHIPLFTCFSYLLHLLNLISDSPDNYQIPRLL